MIEFRFDREFSDSDNMQLDSELLLRAEQGRAICRTYTWSQPWVTLGKFQCREKDLLPEATVAYSERPTGGKAVLHGHDLTLTIACSLDQLSKHNAEQKDLTRSVRTVYRILIEPIIQALNRCGIDAVLAEKTKFAVHKKKTSDCFAHVSANDVVDPYLGLKKCGCALKLTDRAVLLQASIPVKEPLLDPKEIFKMPARYHYSALDRLEFESYLEDELLSLLV